jgi:hypothetical protein
MPNKQYVHDKNQEEKQVNQSILMAMNDHYTKMKKITKKFQIKQIKNTYLCFDITS